MKMMIFDSSRLVSEKLRRYLELDNYFDEVFETDLINEAKTILQKEHVDVILFDIQLTENSGLELVPISRSLSYKPVLILFTNYKLPQYLNIYKQLSIDYCFDKSSELAELKLLIKKIAANLRDQSLTSLQHNFN